MGIVGRNLLLFLARASPHETLPEPRHWSLGVHKVSSWNFGRSFCCLLPGGVDK